MAKVVCYWCQRSEEVESYRDWHTMPAGWLVADYIYPWAKEEAAGACSTACIDAAAKAAKLQDEFNVYHKRCYGQTARDSLPEVASAASMAGAEAHMTAKHGADWRRMLAPVKKA